MFNCVYDLRMYPFDSQICLMEFQVNGIPTRYLDIGIEMPEDCPECDGGEYLGNRNLVEYLVGSTVMEDLSNYSEVFGRARVKVRCKSKAKLNRQRIKLLVCPRSCSRGGGCTTSSRSSCSPSSSWGSPT